MKMKYTGPRYMPNEYEKEILESYTHSDFAYGSLSLQYTGKETTGLRLEISANTGFIGETFSDLINFQTFHNLLNSFVDDVTSAIETKYLELARAETMNHIKTNFPDNSNPADLTAFIYSVIRGRDYNHAPGTVEFRAETETANLALARLRELRDNISNSLREIYTELQ